MTATGSTEPDLNVGPRAGLGAPGDGSGTVTGQVSSVPSGGVAAGDGSGGPASPARNGTAAASGLVFLGCAVVAVRRRPVR
jgi:hypothetical protein